MSLLTRAAALAARALQSQGSAASGSAVGQNVQQVRAMGGSHSRCSTGLYLGAPAAQLKSCGLVLQVATQLTAIQMIT